MKRPLWPVGHQVRAALAMSDYHNFFKLYKQTPNMGAYIIDLFIDKMRISALKTICKAYVSFPLSLLTIHLPLLLTPCSFMCASCRRMDSTIHHRAIPGTGQRST
jgi:hypothetical protein